MLRTSSTAKQASRGLTTRRAQTLFRASGPELTAPGATALQRGWKTGAMNKVSLGTILTVIVAIVIAWFLVNFVLSAVFFLVKLLVVLVVAAIVYVVIRVLLARSTRSSD
jgi:threonine/homoserine/homoserine lactone efflux protein